MLVLGVSLVAILAPATQQRAQADVPGSGIPALPDDVAANLLSDWGITTAAPPPGTSPRIDAATAQARAEDEYSFVGGTAVSTHLVNYSDPDFGDAPSEEAAADENATFTPVYANYLAWLVIVRNASPQVYGPETFQPGATTTVTVAVFIDAATGDDLTAVTLPPQ